MVNLIDCIYECRCEWIKDKRLTFQLIIVNCSSTITIFALMIWLANSRMLAILSDSHLVTSCRQINLFVYSAKFDCSIRVPWNA